MFSCRIAAQSYATQATTVILVPSSTRCGQMKAFEELIAAFR